jgi:hypothetical protein
MKGFILTALSVMLISSGVFAGNHDPKVIIPLLKDSKMTLVEGIEYAEKVSGIATSVKFEVVGGKLVLSVYTISEDLDIEAEKATLTELSGLVTESPFQSHIARASVHMTLFQPSSLTFIEGLNRVVALRGGIPFDVCNPIVRNRRPVAVVVIADVYGSALTVSFDPVSGKAGLMN